MTPAFRKLADSGHSFPVPGGTFTARLWPTLFTVIGMMLLIGLGSWQLQRLEWKENLIKQITTRTKELPQDVRALSPLYWHANGRAASGSHVAVDDLEYRPAAAIGQFLYTGEMYLTATSVTGEGGYHVLTPLQLEDGRWLLVDRGWIPYNRKPDMPGGRGTPGFARPPGVVQVAGLIHVPHRRWLQPANKPSRNEWYGIDLNEMSAAAGLPGFMPFVLEADSDPNSGGFPVGGQTRLDLPNNHLIYALTWFGLALALLVMYGVGGYRRDPKPVTAVALGEAKPALESPDQPLLPYTVPAAATPAVVAPPVIPAEAVAIQPVAADPPVTTNAMTVTTAASTPATAETVEAAPVPAPQLMIENKHKPPFRFRKPQWLIKLFEVPEPPKLAYRRPALSVPVSEASASETPAKKPRKPRQKKAVVAAVTVEGGVPVTASEIPVEAASKPARKRRSKKAAAAEVAVEQAAISMPSAPIAIIKPEVAVPADKPESVSSAAPPVAQAAEPLLAKKPRKPRRKKAAAMSDENGALAAPIDPAKLESLGIAVPAEKSSGGTLH